MTRTKWIAGALAAVATTAALGACGSSDEGGSSDKPGFVPANQDLGGQKGGALTVLASGDVDYLDCGASYYQFSFMICYATQRPLYSFQPDDSVDPSPDLADGQPEISNDGKTVTVKIKSGVKFSPPVDREVTSADVKYAIERGFNPDVANGYAGAYFGDLSGVEAYEKKEAKEITGITTPDDQTIVFKLDRGTGGVLAGALALPLSAPVPQEYAEKFDAKSPSTYGTNQVATGPYMVKNDSNGKVTGYQPGKKIELVRNPNWDSANDYRKAYLDSVVVEEGNDDSTVASRQVLQGTSQVNGDFGPPPPILKGLVKGAQADQLALTPSGGVRYVSLNTQTKPFDNINLRKAVIAGADREAMRLTRGGEVLGPIANHFIPPGVGGFEEAGGLKGTGVDFLANPSGDQQLAASYMKKAGYPSGKYTGNEEVLIVGTSGGQTQKLAELVKTQLEKLGFNTKLRLVTQDTMYTEFCNKPKAKVTVCPNVGWLKDFSDPQTILDPTFNGENIVPENNSNWPMLDVESVNSAMAKAETIVDSDQRNNAWADIDKQVTAQAPAIPWIWDDNPNIRSANVQGVVNKFNGNWDLSFTSIK